MMASYIGYKSYKSKVPLFRPYYKRSTGASIWSNPDKAYYNKIASHVVQSFKKGKFTERETIDILGSIHTDALDDPDLDAQDKGQLFNDFVHYYSLTRRRNPMSHKPFFKPHRNPLPALALAAITGLGIGAGATAGGLLINDLAHKDAWKNPEEHTRMTKEHNQKSFLYSIIGVLGLVLFTHTRKAHAGNLEKATGAFTSTAVVDYNTEQRGNPLVRSRPSVALGGYGIEPIHDHTIR